MKTVNLPGKIADILMFMLGIVLLVLGISDGWQHDWAIYATFIGSILACSAVFVGLFTDW